MNIQVLIIDREELSRRQIRRHIEHAGNCLIVAECDNYLDAMEVIRSSKVDLLFLDLDLPGMTGIDFLRSFSPHPGVVLTSSFDHYALEGYSMDVLDYLIKPVSFKRFMMALDKYARTRTLSVSIFSQDKEESSQDYIYIRESHRIIKLATSEICYIEANHGQLTIQTERQQIKAKNSLEEMLEVLADRPFIRIHREYLVSLDKIRALTPTSVELDQATLPIERKFRPLVYRMMKCTGDLWWENSA